MGKKLEKKNWTYPAWIACWAKANTSIYPVFKFILFFFCKKRKKRKQETGFWPWHDEHLNLSSIQIYPLFLKIKKKKFGQDMTNAWTYSALERIRLELIRLGLYVLEKSFEWESAEGFFFFLSFSFQLCLCLKQTVLLGKIYKRYCLFIVFFRCYYCWWYVQRAALWHWSLP